jgi:carboxyl-terminal processing protease
MRFRRLPRTFNVALAVFLISSVIGACGDSLLDVEFENDPVGNFDALWTEFSRYYALFEVRNVDWDSLYTVYRPLVNENTTDAELYYAMTGLLSHLGDRHVSLIASGFPEFVSGDDEQRLLFSDSDPDNLMSDISAMFNNALYGYCDRNYVNSRKYGLSSYFAAYGTIDIAYTELKVGYAVVNTFSISKDPSDYFDAMTKDFRDNDGVIVDLRVNGGGSLYVARTLINCFADTRRAYAVERYRDGGGRNEFTAPISLFLQPTDNSLKAVPLVVLTSRFTASASELFTLGATTLPLAAVVGDTTAGLFGTVIRKVLPNGWEFTLSPNLVTAADGTCYEGFGLPPEIRVLAKRADIDAGRDAVIDAAIEILESTVVLDTGDVD